MTVDTIKQPRAVCSQDNWVSCLDVNNLLSYKVSKYADSIIERVIVNDKSIIVSFNFNTQEEEKVFDLNDRKMHISWISFKDNQGNTKMMWWSKNILLFYNEFLTKIK